MQLTDIDRISGRRAGGDIAEFEPAAVDAGRGDARSAGQGQAAGLKLGGAQGDGIHIEVAGQGKAQLVVGGSLGDGQVAVGAGKVHGVTRRDIGRVGALRGDIPAAVGDCFDGPKLGDIDGIAVRCPRRQAVDLTKLCGAGITDGHGALRALGGGDPRGVAGRYRLGRITGDARGGGGDGAGAYGDAALYVYLGAIAEHESVADRDIVVAADNTTGGRRRGQRIVVAEDAGIRRVHGVGIAQDRRGHAVDAAVRANRHASGLRRGRGIADGDRGHLCRIGAVTDGDGIVATRAAGEAEGNAIGPVRLGIDAYREGIVRSRGGVGADGGGAGPIGGGVIA
ncbi:Uncharacterised protein [Bordetella pseudohinzii]|uniref:Uncharacterized protein n=1 Tax=Bordetella pseudohinzii TaxID=1331258 RepID=A0A0M7H3V9_9BORD|nr:Uncharacterised protein [Bordetella pseudohinzii]